MAKHEPHNEAYVKHVKSEEKAGHAHDAKSAEKILNARELSHTEKHLHQEISGQELTTHGEVEKKKRALLKTTRSGHGHAL